MTRTPPDLKVKSIPGVRAFLLLLLALCLAPLLPAQSPVQTDCGDDVGSPDQILHALYEVISGPAGQERDWDRFRCLCHPKAQLIPVFPKKDNPEMSQAAYFDVETFIEKSKPIGEAQGFFESEIHREIQLFGDIAQVFSTYEGRHSQDDPEPFVRGINSIQLQFDGQRWWVINVFWQAETEKYPIPEKFLPEKN